MNDIIELITAQAADDAEDTPTPPKKPRTVSVDPAAIANLDRLLAQPMPRPPGRR